MITLNAIKTEHAKITEMIEAFEAQEHEPRTIYFPSAAIVLEPDEHYAGIIIGKDGGAPYHLMLLPGEAESVTFEKAKEWAKKQGGELPTRREQSLLFANLKEWFQPSWYWSSEQFAPNLAYAWAQGFINGYQGYCHEFGDFRARAVRRLTIQ
jgi:hypothetical protein